jgi:hypothetical protein
VVAWFVFMSYRHPSKNEDLEKHTGHNFTL